jgi:hypothetical protein
MNCQDLRRLLDNLGREQLDLDATSAVLAHTQTCGACAESWTAVAALREQRIPATPPALLGNIVESCAECERVPDAGRRVRLGWAAFMLTVVGAALAATVILVTTSTEDADSMKALADSPPPDAAEDSTSTNADGSDGPSVTEKAGVRAPAGDSPQAASTSRDTISLDDYSIVVVLSVDRNAADTTQAAVRSVESRLIERLSAEGFNMISGAAVSSYVQAGFEDVEIGRLLGAAVVVTIDSETLRERPQVRIELVDAETESAFGLSVLAIDAVEIFDDFDSPFGDASPLDAIVRSIERRTAPATSLEPEPTTAEIVAENTQTALDTTLSDQDRMMGIVRLRGAQGSIRQDAVIFAAIELAAASDDATVRGTIWQQLRGADSGYLIEPLLAAIDTESDEFARREAAATLADYADDARVRAALERLSRNDASERVREAATGALLPEAELDEMLKARIVDPALPVADRMRALMMNPFGDGRFGFDGSVPIDGEVADALIAIAFDPANDEIDRAAAVLFLRQAATPRSTAILLELLAGDESARVRAAAASALTGAAGETAVRVALEDASDEDSDRSVRSAARRALDGAP